MTFRIVMTTVLALSTQLPDVPSMRDRAKEQGGTAINELFSEPQVTSLPDLLKKSDVVLYGRIAGLRTVLTPDEKFVATEYQIIPIEMIKQTRPTNAAPRPGIVPGIVVRRIGGRLNEGDMHYVTANHAYPIVDPLKLNDEVVFFLLERSETVGMYEFTAGIYGAFRVANGQVLSVSPRAAHLRGDKPMAVTALVMQLQQPVNR